MNRNECKKQIEDLRLVAEEYRNLIINDPRGKQISVIRSSLNQKYGRLEKYINIIGSDISSVYLEAFGNYSVHVVNNSLLEVIQNLDRIIGRLDDMTDQEFQIKLKTNELKPVGLTSDSYLKIRLSILEFVSVTLFAFCFTLIFALTKTFHFTYFWSALWPYMLMFFGLGYSVLYLVFPIIRISDKVGSNVIDVYKEFMFEFRSKSKLGKIKIIATVILAVMALIEFLPHLFKITEKI